MTFQEFDSTKFYKGIKAIYENETYLIRYVEFQERLFGLVPVWFVPGEDDNDGCETWVRCENCELLHNEQDVQVSDTTKISKE